ncbi:hypothetical protein [Chryseobacterium herbae]|uniref:Uncharacterized protein n=1 Tax=Chryseobacterium herbae TaxID=2976476 RepID=A0ABT2ITM0_9FLAO|nr:hypothetical protein [Chryseobacterium sp. pc1-10]MCT2561851.1 hypothetical protein [Chryseobacterium sp. pc1-10]
MTIEIYTATLTHDKGKMSLTVISLSGEQGAKKQIMVSEGCPESAIIKIEKLTAKSQYNTN